MPKPRDLGGVVDGEIICIGSGLFSTNMGSSTSASRATLEKLNSAANGYIVRMRTTAGAFVGGAISISYTI
jgi:hypothetical protein